MEKDKDPADPAQKLIPINGFHQVLEMLRVADPSFRESLLRRIGAKDPTLAQNLRRDLRKSTPLDN